jgi:hypothetical protein
VIEIACRRFATLAGSFSLCVLYLLLCSDVCCFAWLAAVRCVLFIGTVLFFSFICILVCICFAIACDSLIVELCGWVCHVFRGRNRAPSHLFSTCWRPLVLSCLALFQIVPGLACFVWSCLLCCCYYALRCHVVMYVNVFCLPLLSFLLSSLFSSYCHFILSSIILSPLLCSDLLFNSFLLLLS